MNNLHFAPGANYYPAPPHALLYGIYGNLVLDIDKFEQQEGHMTLQFGKEKYYLTIDNKTTKFKISGNDVFPDGLRAFVKEDGTLTADIYFNTNILLDWSKGIKKLRFTLRKSKNGNFYLMLNTNKKEEQTQDIPF